ncbi:hypothetical protein JCM19232_4214 [Vibrio ishigakensis]|uniref:Uncharacterized protein n=1 Tax=Vibrio ishigakensis TaxID=1481914 RepID=A0A0B8PRF5_9VIBR|nr:hypothetical protein JCM19232_4214 [Vibrio ishigakensis]
MNKTQLTDVIALQAYITKQQAHDETPSLKNLSVFSQFRVNV